ncbi:hypothetical protein N9Z65_00875 [bacterium]|nr:hypothetical protein [bacterium]
MSSQLGKDYFLHLLQDEDVKKEQEVKKDVTVCKDTLKQLEALGLIKNKKKECINILKKCCKAV